MKKIDKKMNSTVILVSIKSISSFIHSSRLYSVPALKVCSTTFELPNLILELKPKDK